MTSDDFGTVRIRRMLVSGAGVVALMLIAVIGTWQGVQSLLGSVEQLQAANSGEATDMGEYVGWYELEPDSAVFLTWAANGGLRLYDIPGHRVHRFSLKGENSFEWKMSKSGPTRRVWFTKGESGVVERLSWQVDDGKEGFGKRLPGHGYAQEEVRFANKDVTLVGTVLLPRGEGPHPGVVFIHGSGTSDRDNIWYFSIADRFVRNGFAVLFPDKRGSGMSGGTWQTSSMQDFAGDSLAAVEVLRKHASVDPDRVGLLGISQGGAIAPLAASLSTEISFVINVAGGAATFNELLVHESRQTLRQQGLPESFLGVAVSMAKAKRPTWWELNGDYDPVDYWKQVRVPVLTVYGEEDEKDNVPIRKSVARLKKEIPKELNPDFEVRVFPETGHAFLNREKTWIREDFFVLLIDWASAIVKQGG